jgi:hypothetical protein
MVASAPGSCPRQPMDVPGTVPPRGPTKELRWAKASFGATHLRRGADRLRRWIPVGARGSRAGRPKDTACPRALFARLTAGATHGGTLSLIPAEWLLRNVPRSSVRRQSSTWIFAQILRKECCEAPWPIPPVAGVGADLRSLPRNGPSAIPLARPGGSTWI